MIIIYAYMCHNKMHIYIYNSHSPAFDTYIMSHIGAYAPPDEAIIRRIYTYIILMAQHFS